MQQDYILRMIQQMTGFLVRVTILRKEGRNEEAIREIEDAYGRFSGLSPTLVHAISDDDLVQLLRARGTLDAERTWALGDLLREEALSYEELGQTEEATPRMLKSLRLSLEALEVLDDTPVGLDVTGLELAIDRAEDMEVPRTTRAKLIDYLVRTGRFDRAENFILWGLDAEDATAFDVTEAIVFYENLLRLPDSSLVEGGLPRDEVEAGLSRLRTILP